MSVIAAGEAAIARRRGIPGLRGTGCRRPRLRRRDRVRAADRGDRAVHRAVRPELHPAAVRVRRAGRRPLPRLRRPRPRPAVATAAGARRRRVFGAVAVAGISIVVGTVLAIVAAWRGGWLDNAIGALLDVLFAFPGILIAVMAAAVFGPSLKTAVIALSVAYTPYIARVLRGAALRERAQLYISALEVQGLRRDRDLRPPPRAATSSALVVAQGTILFGYAMVDLAAISFIGLGVQSPQADWGVMVSEGRAGVLHGLPARVAVGGPLHRRRRRGRQPARRAPRRPRPARGAVTSLLEIENLTVDAAGGGRAAHRAARRLARDRGGRGGRPGRRVGLRQVDDRPRRRAAAAAGRRRRGQRHVRRARRGRPARQRAAAVPRRGRGRLPGRPRAHQPGAHASATS